VSKVYITDRSGREEAIDIQPGETLMQAISNAGVDDLLALCGGVCACATCHVYLDESSCSAGDPNDDEDALLDGSSRRRKNSRLSCQIRLSDKHDGLRATIAPED